MPLLLHIYIIQQQVAFLCSILLHILPHRQIKYPVDFDDELKIRDIRYDDIT